jgi:nitrogen-specific signal transduction histidine kinase/ActR/RegA family two-component response regulator
MPSDLMFGCESLVSAEKETVRTLIRQERLLALGQMASGIAHDINNSLTPIIGYSDFLLDARSGLPEESKKCLQCIRTAAADIAQMVEQVRQFYRKRDEAEPVQSIDLNALARQVIEMTRPRWRDIPQREGLCLNLETDLAKNLPPIQGCEDELRQAMTQLLLNAVDASPEGGSIAVATRTLHRNSRAGNCSEAVRVALEVRDTGVGMDESTKQRCLEPFFSTKGPRGSGLGLAMVYGAMRRHDGTIEVESEPGQGTTVRLLFKVATLASAPEAAVPNGVQERPLRILCIDDDRRIGAMLQKVLTSDHHLVEVANDGEKGVEVFRKARELGQPFHVVITDLGMPNVDGRQIVRLVKKEAPATPVIVLTGWAATIDGDGRLPDGVDAIVSKPPSIDRLQEVLSQVTVAKVLAT